MTLTKNQIQHLKGLAHNLKPTVLIGNNGLTQNVINEITITLEYHELIKIKVTADNREAKLLIVEAILQKTSAQKVSLVGHILTIYQPRKEPKVALPRK